MSLFLCPFSRLLSSLPARFRLVIASQVSSRHCRPGCVSSLPAVTGNLADCKVDGCRRRALRAARAYAVHPSCRFLSRWVQRCWFKGTGRQGRAPINFEKWGGMSVQNYRNNSEWEPSITLYMAFPASLIITQQAMWRILLRNC